MSEPLNEKERRVLTSPDWVPTRPVSPPEPLREAPCSRCESDWHYTDEHEEPEAIEVRRILAKDGRMLLVVGPFSGPDAARAQDETGPTCTLCHEPITARADDPASHVGCCLADLNDCCSAATPASDSGAEDDPEAMGTPDGHPLGTCWNCGAKPVDTGAEERLRAAARDALTVMEEAWPDRPATLNLRSALSGGSVDEEARNDDG